MRTLIKNATLVNEGKTFQADVLIKNERIEQISAHISAENTDRIISAEGKILIPGVIDDQVHFREPGLTQKATIQTESAAAVAGGVTSYFEQPNTNPQTTNLELLEQKFAIASQSSYANYSFFLGGTNTNLDQIQQLNPRACAGVKLFLGSSTGNMLVDDAQVLETIFRNSPTIIAAHCEDEATIRKNLEHYQRLHNPIPIALHPHIRSAEACFLSSQKAIALAEKTHARLHIFHISTGKEVALFRNDLPLEQKRITAEVCVHHLWFSEEDYTEKGALIKWNPAVKTAQDRSALWEGLLNDNLDVIATDHAPHTLAEKYETDYLKVPSGAPMVQHSLAVMLQCVSEGRISMEKVVQKMCHNPAILFQIEARGFLREGYFADFALIDPEAIQFISKENILYKCGWSPLEGQTLKGKVTHTFVNGNLVYENGSLQKNPFGKRITFER